MNDFNSSTNNSSTNNSSTNNSSTNSSSNNTLATVVKKGALKLNQIPLNQEPIKQPTTSPFSFDNLYSSIKGEIKVEELKDENKTTDSKSKDYNNY